jgi:hypothetical protein
MADSPDVHLLEAHGELKRWVSVNDKKLESLMARDEDHVSRMENVSYMVCMHARGIDQTTVLTHIPPQLYSLVGQRDMRVQSSIARATQRDSEDMKFIAVLGSIFLPASLIAVSSPTSHDWSCTDDHSKTILNVPEFQFALGTTLFGAYIGITIPLIAIVMLLCFGRSQLKQCLWR